MPELIDHIATLLNRDATVIGARWREQAPSVAPRAALPADADRIPQAAAIIRSLGDVLRNDPRSQDALMRAGWELGAASYTAGLSLHYMLKEIDLLTAMTLYACERAVTGHVPSTARDGIAVARQLNRGFSLLTIAAAKGFTDTYLAGLRAEYRTIRHDLRNPLGTITGAVSLMNDDTMTAERRNDPRFRAMVERNATSMNALIGARLSDASADAPAFARQEVSLRDIALTVRRDLREAAAAAGCGIDVGDLPTVRTDSTGFELALRSVVTAALLSARPGSAIGVGPATLHDHSVHVPVSFEPAADETGLHTIPDGRFDFAQELTRRAGGTVRLGTPLRLEMPVSPAVGSSAHELHDRPGRR